jgi:hypothetical protein
MKPLRVGRTDFQEEVNLLCTNVLGFSAQKLWLSFKQSTKGTNLTLV